MDQERFSYTIETFTCTSHIHIDEKWTPKNQDAKWNISVFSSQN